mgnify:CR=1 FL=1
MLRTTVRVNHGSSIVTLEDRVEVPVKHYERDIMKNTNIPALARNKHKTVAGAAAGVLQRDGPEPCGAARH